MVSPGKGPRVSTKQLHDMTYRLATDIALNNKKQKQQKTDLPSSKYGSTAEAAYDLNIRTAHG